MPKGQPLGESQRKAIYHAYTEGEMQADIAAIYGISVSTVSRVINRQREKESMAAREKVVAGDKANGRLTSTTDPHRFEGTCVIGGKRHSKTFVNVNARKATEMWEKWCQELRDEEAFMDMVERKEPETQSLEEIVPVPAPIIEVKRWEDVAKERQQRIEELEAQIAEMQEAVDFCKRVEEAVKTGETVELWGVEYVKPTESPTDKPAYVLWAKTDTPRMYGVYQHMNDALGDMDRLNDVAAFLGNEDVFEVEEVVWRG